MSAKKKVNRCRKEQCCQNATICLLELATGVDVPLDNGEGMAVPGTFYPDLETAELDGGTIADVLFPNADPNCFTKGTEFGICVTKSDPTVAADGEVFGISAVFSRYDNQDPATGALVAEQGVSEKQTVLAECDPYTGVSPQIPQPNFCWDKVEITYCIPPSLGGTVEAEFNAYS